MVVPGYRVQTVLSSNGRTCIARAIRLSDGQSVILKRLEESYTDTSSLSRLSFSYDILCKFEHPNIIKPLEWVHGEHIPTIVFEDSDSVDLRCYLGQFKHQQLPLEIFLNIAVQIANALSVIHYAQVIHKDIHLGNVLVNPKTGIVQVIDFGLASLLSREQPALASPELLEGTLPYISPEQTGRMNRALDYRTDFYSLGVCFYYLLAGKPPFESDDALGLVHAHIAKTQQPLVEIRDDVPEVLSKIIDKLMSKSAEDRYQSAHGLEKDLQRCRRSVAMNQALPIFPLGLDDVADRFQVPQKLYGREHETALLMSLFDDAASGEAKMLAVSGYSGIGKSALVHEVHKPIAEHNGLFVSGKFDQFQRNTPYSALQTALKQWLQYVLSLPSDKLQELKDQLSEEFGASGRVLIDFMPEFEWVLGELSDIVRLGAEETKNRFQIVFQRFIALITRQKPLVIFIDDIQWADRGTLELLPILLSEVNCRLLLIVAYRDNEVESGHPVVAMLDKIEQSPLYAHALWRVQLGPLDQEQVNELLQDALFRHPSELDELASLIHQKTAGNPFFISEFLKSLYNEKLLDFDLSKSRWGWDIHAITSKDITDNVVVLMLRKMALMPPITQSLIQQAACIGGQFGIDRLALLVNKPLATVAQQLWPALKDGLLLQDGRDWLLGMVYQSAQGQDSLQDGTKLLAESSPLSLQCRFLHDRMLQAAYSSLTELERQQIHLKIGQMLLSESDKELSDEACFAIVEQLNQAQPLITNLDECERLAMLNLQAARRAKESGVWQAASDYSAVGIAVTKRNKLQCIQECFLPLMHIKAESEYLNGRPDIAEKYYNELFGYLEDDYEKAKILATRLIQSIGRGQWIDGVRYGMEALSFLNVRVPSDDELLESIKEERRLYERLIQKVPLESIADLPDMTDKNQLVTMQVLPNLTQCTSILKDSDLGMFCALKGINLILKFGKSDLAALHLACFAFTARAAEDLNVAVAAGKQAYTIAMAQDSCREVSNCLNTLSTAVLNLVYSYEKCIDIHMMAVRLGWENGEVARACISQTNALFFKIAKGEPLPVVHQAALDVIDICDRNAIFHPMAKITKMYTEGLMSEGSNVALLDDESFGSDFAKIELSFHHFYLEMYRSHLLFWHEKYEPVVDTARSIQTGNTFKPKFTFIVDQYLLCGLCLANNWDKLSDDEFSMLEGCRSKLADLYNLNSNNFAHKYFMLEAVVAWRGGESMDEIVRLFDEAISTANEVGFLQYQALANELCVDYWVSLGLERQAESYAVEALRYYTEWGCRPRVESLERRYAHLLGAYRNRSQFFYSTLSNSQSKAHQVLDMQSIVKSTQVISSELRLDALAEKVLQIIVECAGATSSALVLERENELVIEATCTSDGAVEVPSNILLLDDCDAIPVSMITYALRCNDVVNVGDIRKESLFADDAYVTKTMPRSALCMPVNYRDRTIGALYLENNLSINAFTEERLDVIKLLLTQAAISLVNANLFNEVSTLNQTLERKVEDRTAALATANEDLKAFSYSVSHDLRAPLRAARGFSEMLQEDYVDSLDGIGVDLLNRIIKSNDKMSDLIEGLLELSRVQRSIISKEEVDLSKLVCDQMVEMRDRFPYQRVETTVKPGCRVIADRRLMHSVVENLVGNAWKYSSKKPEAIIEFGALSLGELGVPQGVGRVPESLDKNSMIYFIKDNGAGFDTSNIEGLFDTFKRFHSDKQFPGTGIGLATVSRIIEKHNGYLWCESDVEKGSTFYFSLSQ